MKRNKKVKVEKRRDEWSNEKRTRGKIIEDKKREGGKRVEMRKF